MSRKEVEDGEWRGVEASRSGRAGEYVCIKMAHSLVVRVQVVVCGLQWSVARQRSFSAVPRCTELAKTHQNVEEGTSGQAPPQKPVTAGGV